MTNMNPIASTKVAAGSGGQQALAGSATSGVLAGVGSVGMSNFWEMILARITAPENKASIPQTENTDTKKAQPENSLVMLQVALAAQNIDAEGNLALTPSNDTKTIKAQLDVTNQILNHLKNMLPDNAEQKGLFNQVLSKLQAKSDALQASLSALENGVITKDTPVEDIPLPLLISLGLSPSEITEASEKIQDLEKKLGREITVEDLIAGVGGIIPPAPETATVATASLKSNIVENLDDNAQPTDDLARQLNALDIGGEEPLSLKKPNTPSDASADPSKKPSAGIEALPAEGYKGNPDKTELHAFKKNLESIKSDLGNMLNSNKAQQGDMTFPAHLYGGETDSLLFQPPGTMLPSSTGFTSTAQAANVIATPATAGQAHPATQMVAATIAQSAKDGKDNVMTLRMDPPELGNVNIRLQFGKDKSVKAHILVEKPDTYNMLQRDQQTLERALHSAGLDANADSISFELAQDNSAFNRNNSGAENNNNFGSGNAGTQDADGVEIIQSSVTWQVDPSTGHVRYNIFA